jgi:hypothetical protein
MKNGIRDVILVYNRLEMSYGGTFDHEGQSKESGRRVHGRLSGKVEKDCLT